MGLVKMSQLLDVTNLTVRFGGLVALNNVSFDLHQGEIVGLIGPNGAGKTTMFSTLVGLVKPTEGHILLRGKEVGGKRPHEVAQAGMTKTFQNISLFPGMNVRDNVIVAALSHADLDEAKLIADRALARLNLSSIAELNVNDLTFPQRALVEVARAIATNSKILLLDEVMAALNPLEMDAVMEVLRSLKAEGFTLFVVEHHMRAIMRLCDRILVLQFGALIAQGTPVEIATNSTVIEAYLGKDSKEHH